MGMRATCPRTARHRHSRVLRSRPRCHRAIPAEAPRRSVSPGGAIGFGAFSMATNFTTRWLNALGRLITVHGRTVVVVVVAALGGYLLGHGVLKLAHL